MTAVFERYVCWQPQALADVLPVEAERPSDPVFLATHQPAKLLRSLPGERLQWTPYSEERFLDDFLNSSRDFTFVPVIGKSGSGKSHLVRWLATHIPRDERYWVVVIPKHKTNLKAVIGLILEGLSGSPFDEFRQRLQGAAESLSPEQASIELLSKLEYLVGPDTPDAKSENDQALKYLRGQLPAFLTEPTIREQLRRPGGPVDRLVREALFGRGSEDKEAPHAFTREDLPLSVSSIQQANTQVQGFYRQLLSRANLVDGSLELLNRYLPAAVRALYNLGGNELQELVRDLRRTLRERGKELVLLVEDFALLQGIQGQLLDALLEQPERGGESVLCAIRTALAVTSGYFDRMETAATRASFLVSLDVEQDDREGSVSRDDLAEFFGRYLNAVRVGANELAAARGARNDPSLDWVRNACASCPYQAPCHASFQATNAKGELGYGLYPFNPQSVARLSERVSREHFNPRAVLRKVIHFTLMHGAQAIKEQDFPPEAFLEQFPAQQLSPGDKLKLQQLDLGNAERHENVVNLWGPTPGRLTDLAPGIHTAFGLKTVGQAPIVDSGGEKEITRLKPPVTTKSLAFSEELAALSDWANGKALPQAPASTLRNLVFDALSLHIDWEAEILNEKVLSEAGLWSFSGITFADQQQRFNRPTGAIEVTIPSRPEGRAAAAFALQGLVLLQRHGNWEFTDGAAHQAALRARLDEWADEALRQARGTTFGGETTDPVPALVETLYAGAALTGAVPVDAESDAEHLHALLVTPPESPAFDSWSDLHRSYRERHAELLQAFYARAGIAKGIGSVRLLDASQALPALQKAREALAFVHPLPAALDKRDNPVSQARNALSKGLEPAVNKAIMGLQSELNQLTSALPSDLSEAAWQETLAALKQGVQDARQAGVLRFPQGQANTADDDLNVLQAVPAPELLRKTSTALARVTAAAPKATTTLLALRAAPVRDLQALRSRLQRLESALKASRDEARRVTKEFTPPDKENPLKQIEGALTLFARALGDIDGSAQ